MSEVIKICFIALPNSKGADDVEDLILKVGEFGALGIVTLYLLTQGKDAIKDLAQSNKLLADSVKLLADKVNLLDNHVDDIKQQNREIREHLNKIENRLDDLRRYMEKNAGRE